MFTADVQHPYRKFLESVNWIEEETIISRYLSTMPRLQFISINIEIDKYRPEKRHKNVNGAGKGRLNQLSFNQEI